MRVATFVRGGSTIKHIMTRKTESWSKLLDAELKRFIEVASEELDAEKVIIFGSFARGRAEGIHEWTDLDLVVATETSLPFPQRIKRLLEVVRPKVGADVFVYTPDEWEFMKSQRPFIKEEVLKKGRVVYERGG
jgi:predicted nucleotidyltransferase